MIDIFEQLGDEGIALLRRHNQLRPLLQQLVVEEALAGVLVEEPLREQAWQRFAADQERAVAIEKAQRTHGWTLEDLEWQLLLPIRVQQASQERFGPKAESHFLTRKAQLDHVTYSLLRVKDPHLAQELYLRIAGGEASFAELVLQHSDGPEKLSQGLIGPSPMGKAHPLLAEKLRTARDQDLIPPFRVAEWWLVARRETFQPAAFNAQVAQRMTQELFEIWVQEETQRKIQLLGSSWLPTTA